MCDHEDKVQGHYRTHHRRQSEFAEAVMRRKSKDAIAAKDGVRRIGF
jgi:hypothetical protein